MFLIDALGLAILIALAITLFVIARRSLPVVRPVRIVRIIRKSPPRAGRKY